MNNKIFLWIILVNLAGFTALSLIYPHLMISPGQLIAGHQKLTTDCFACHRPWFGSSPEKCAACHKPEQIGRFNTEGVALVSHKTKTPFHQDLIEKDCVACHGDHQGMQPYRTTYRFSHELLAKAAQKNCETCHDVPADKLHRKFKDNCGQCHSQERWKPAAFKHDLLDKAVLNACETCHDVPTDKLHRKIKDRCGQCHRTEQWKPADFNHNQYFRFDRNHETECETCHENNDYSRYTCYGCHEHSPAKIRSEHEEEGIYNFENCVECHRSGDEDEAKHGGRGKHGDGLSREFSPYRERKREKEHDD